MPWAIKREECGDDLSQEVTFPTRILLTREYYNLLHFSPVKGEKKEKGCAQHSEVSFLFPNRRI